MTAMGMATVLLFHTVVTGGLSESPADAPERSTADRALAHPTVHLAQGWRYPHRRYYVPIEIFECEDYDCSPSYRGGEQPWRPVSLSLSAGLAYATDSGSASRGNGAALSARLGANLVDRLSLTVALEGSDSLRDGADERECAALLGLQWYATPYFYMRGAYGTGIITSADPVAQARYFGTSGDDGLHPALSAALGLELDHTQGFALAVETSATWVYLPDTTWSAWQASLVLIFF